MNYSTQTGNHKNLIFSLKFWVLTISLVAFYATLLFSQNIIYIDPTNAGDPDKDGSINHPFSAWTDFSLQSNTTYLQKRGTAIQLTSTLDVNNISNVTIGAYGEGAKPIIYAKQNSNNDIIKVSRTNNAVIRDLHLTKHPTSTTTPTAGVHVSGHWSSGGSPTLNTSIINCEISYVWNGVRGLPYQTVISGVTIDSSLIHHIDNDGVFIKDCPNVTVRNSHFHHVNLDFWKKGITEDVAHGDAIHLVNDCDNYLIENNILDKRATGCKFNFIYGNTGYRPVRGRVIGNLFYPGKDTTGASSTTAIYISRSEYVEIAYNRIIGRGYEPNTTPGAIALIQADTIDMYYNVMDSVYGVTFAGVSGVKHVNLYNNTAVVNRDVNRVFLFSGVPSGYARNNIVAARSGNTIQRVNSANVLLENNELHSGPTSSWNNDIGIINWENGNFNLIPGSVCIDSGYNYSDYFYDLNGLPVPQGTARDKGAFEFPQGGASNNPPVINNQTFQIEENSPNGTSVGTIVATDPDSGQSLTFFILAGNTGGTFGLNASTGLLSVANNTLLDYETNPVFSLTVLVTDDGSPPMSSQATITVNLIDINEAPVMDDQTFQIAENSPNGSVVGTIVATDPDNGQTLTFTILSGNTGGTFGVNSSSGQITVADNTLLDYQSNPVFTLNVQVTDDGSPPLSDNATITINLLDVNEPPEINDQNFQVAENSPNGTTVGTIVATDPDNGQSLVFAILAGNTGNTFVVDAATGIIIVADNTLLNFETHPVFTLTVQVTDNGTPPLSDQATITINLLDVNEPPEINDQNFQVAEYSPNGTTVGTITATDPDIGQTLTFSILSGNMGNTFAVDPLTGGISVLDNTLLNMTTNPVFSLAVEVTDSGTPPLSDQAIITINVYDNNQPPVINDQALQIEENSPNGTIVGTLVAFDPDPGQTLSFSIISGNTGNTFALNSASGQITVANNTLLDYETYPVFTLIVQVLDNGTPPLSDHATITINVLDVNEAPVMDDQTFQIAENSPDGSVVGSIVATDPDIGQTLTFSILGGNTGGTFAVNSSSGQITVSDNSLLDYETNPVFTLTVQVVDNGIPPLSDMATITINVLDVNEPPVMNDQTFSIEENSPDGTVVGTVVATDPDNGQTLSFTILAGNTGGTFALNGSSGQITVATNTLLDYETNPVFNLTIQVTDNGIPAMSDQAVITINVLDVNEHPVMEDQTFQIAENSPNGSVVGTIVATDPDIGQTLTFTILAGNTGSTFAVNSSSGQITVANNTLLDYETNPIFTLTVQVADNGVPPLSDMAAITINILDVNEPPVINDQTFSIEENSPVGTVVGIVIATDPDIGQTLMFTILSGNPGNTFSIDTYSGQLTVTDNTMLDFETHPVFDLTIEVMDNGIPAMSDEAIITINILDVNEAPVMDDQVFNISELSPNGTIVGNIVATDPDYGQTLTFTIISGNTGNTFALDAPSGQITVNDNSLLDSNTNPAFLLLVQVADDGTPVLTDEAVITINVYGVNYAPTINDQTFEIEENSPAGTVVGNLVATDPNVGQTLTYTLLSGNLGGTFTVNQYSGQITVADNTLLDFESNPVFTMVVEVADNGIPVMTDQATITINLIDVNEAPVINPQVIEVSFDALVIFMDSLQVTHHAGFVTAADPDEGQTLTFEIMEGNEEGIWELNSTTGEIRLVDPDGLNLIAEYDYQLIVKVTDNHPEPLSASASVIISVHLQKLDEYLEIIGSLGVDESTEGKNHLHLNVYPNPAVDLITIKLNNYPVISEFLDITILDLNGKILIRQEYESQYAQSGVDLDVSGLSKGLYMVIVQHGKVSELGKFQKQ